MTEADYEQRIKKLDWFGLNQLWADIKQKKTLVSGWAAGKALEYLILRAFELDSATVRYPYSVKIDGEVTEQIDGVIHLNGLSCLVEAKDYGREPDPNDPNDTDNGTNVNFEPIAKMRSQLLRRPGATIGSIFTTSGFTSPALTLAKYLAPQTILLWEKSHLDVALQKQQICSLLVRKYQWCVETGEPDFDVTLIP